MGALHRCLYDGIGVDCKFYYISDIRVKDYVTKCIGYIDGSAYSRVEHLVCCAPS